MCPVCMVAIRLPTCIHHACRRPPGASNKKRRASITTAGAVSVPCGCCNHEAIHLDTGIKVHHLQKNRKNIRHVSMINDAWTYMANGQLATVLLPFVPAGKHKGSVTGYICARHQAENARRIAGLDGPAAQPNAHEAMQVDDPLPHDAVASDDAMLALLPGVAGHAPLFLTG